MAKHPYPRDLSPSRLLLLALHQEGRDLADVGDVRSVLDQVIAGARAIDCSDQARADLVRALEQADDRRVGRVRVWIDYPISLE